MTVTAPRENISANTFGMQCVNVFDKDGQFVEQILCFGTEKKARLKAKLAAMTSNSPEYAETHRAYLAA